MRRMNRRKVREGASETEKGEVESRRMNYLMALLYLCGLKVRVYNNSD